MDFHRSPDDQASTLYCERRFFSALVCLNSLGQATPKQVFSLHRRWRLSALEGLCCIASFLNGTAPHLFSVIECRSYVISLPRMRNNLRVSWLKSFSKMLSLRSVVFLSISPQPMVDQLGLCSDRHTVLHQNKFHKGMSQTAKYIRTGSCDFRFNRWKILPKFSIMISSARYYTAHCLGKYFQDQVRQVFNVYQAITVPFNGRRGLRSSALHRK